MTKVTSLTYTTSSNFSSFRYLHNNSTNLSKDYKRCDKFTRNTIYREERKCLVVFQWHAVSNKETALTLSLNVW